jgi:hypothetical protein
MARHAATGRDGRTGATVQLPHSVRESLVDDIDEFLEAFSSDPEPEQVANYVIELLETYADEEGIDDIVASLEEEAELEGSLHETLETEMSSNDEFEYTGEEVISILERLCGIEWDTDEDDEDDWDEDDEDDEDEDDEEEEEN